MGQKPPNSPSFLQLEVGHLMSSHLHLGTKNVSLADWKMTPVLAGGVETKLGCRGSSMRVSCSWTFVALLHPSLILILIIIRPCPIGIGPPFFRSD